MRSRGPLFVLSPMLSTACRPANSDLKRRFQMKSVTTTLLTVMAALVMLFAAVVNPPKAEAVPSYARQTGLACSGCHYNPPELNPAGRRFKLMGYVDKADETKVIKTEGGKKSGALDLLSSLPLSVMVDVSFTNTKTPTPTTQNGNFEF